MINGVERFIGVPYRKNGRSFKGCDCFGIVYLVWSSFGVSAPMRPYLKLKSLDDWKERVMNEILTNIDKGTVSKVEISDLKPLDMLVFKMPARGLHFGVYVGDDCFIHLMEASRHSTRERLSSGTFWLNRYLMGVRKV